MRATQLMFTFLAGAIICLAYGSHYADEIAVVTEVGGDWRLEDKPIRSGQPLYGGSRITSRFSSALKADTRCSLKLKILFARDELEYRCGVSIDLPERGYSSPVRKFWESLLKWLDGGPSKLETTISDLNVRTALQG